MTFINWPLLTFLNTDTQSWSLNLADSSISSIMQILNFQFWKQSNQSFIFKCGLNWPIFSLTFAFSYLGNNTCQAKQWCDESISFSWVILLSLSFQGQAQAFSSKHPLDLLYKTLCSTLHCEYKGLSQDIYGYWLRAHLAV